MSAYDGGDLSRPKSSHGRHANDTVNEDARPKSSQGRRDDGLDDFEKELNTYIEKEEKANENTDDKMEKGQTESQGSDKKGERQVLTLHSDNEDSELDDYNLTEDQKRALEELDNLKTDLGYPDEDPPEYDVKERLKVLNEELKNDPTPIEKQNDSKVGFSQNLISLMAPPPDFSDGEEEDKSGKNTQKQKQAEDKDKVDDKSEAINGGNPSKKSNIGGKKDKVLIEIDGQFQLLDSDDVRARDLGHVMDHDKENEKRKSKVQPMPPVKPRPATATNGSRRNVRTTQARQRPQSAGNMNNKDPLDNFHYNSPYALSPREKQLMEERKKAFEKQKQEEEKRKKEENEQKDEENKDAFEFWLKKKREKDRRKKIHEEEERKRSDKDDRGDNSSEQGDNSSERSENDEAFKGWLSEKNNQFKKEKLLKRRQDQEMHEGYYVRSRDDCEKAYKLWLKHKAVEARKARVTERTKAKLQRLAARRARKSINLSKSIKESQSFRYVDYYGYRF